VCQVCSNAQYKDGALVQEGPARDAFVATVSQRMADRRQSRRQTYWKQLGHMRQCGTNCSFESLPSIAKELITLAGKKKGLRTLNIMVDRARRPVRIGATWCKAIVAQDPTIDGGYAEQGRKQRPWARAWATDVEVAEDDTNFGSQEGEDSNRESTHEVGKSVHLQGRCHRGTSLGAPNKGC
jgi:hypothetical protein